MAHILFIYKQFPAPSVGHAGGASLFRLMQGLHQRGHHISLVARILETERSHMPAVQSICEQVYTVAHHRDVPGPRPFAIAHSYLAFRRTVARALQQMQPELVHVETTQSAAIVTGLPLPPASFRTQDVNWFLQAQQAKHSQGLARFKAWGMERFFRCFEPWLWRRYDVRLAISEGDKRLMTSTFPDSPPLLLPLAPAMDPAQAASPAVDGEHNVLFVGAMSRDHNINGILWFLDHIWPHIQRDVPEARLFIVGGSPPDQIRERANGTSVIVTGFVEDLSAWYRSAAVFVSPLRVAGGLLQKIVDAMALGVPVVATSVCNHGLSATPDIHLLTEDTPIGFAETVVALLRDPKRRAHLGAAGQQFIEQHYAIESAIDHWEQALQSL